jgi:hypothetical protein
MQLDVDPTSPLAVVRVAARHQVRGNVRSDLMPFLREG